MKHFGEVKFLNDLLTQHCEYVYFLAMTQMTCKNSEGTSPRSIR